MSQSSAAAEILISGRVQGVGYRAWAQREAVRRGAAGYVMNLEDGRVYVHAEADHGVIEDLVDALRRGPRLAHVQDVDVRWVSPSGDFSSFMIRDGGRAG